MAALTQDRNTPSRHGDRRSFPVAAATKLFAGALAALNASGYAVPGSTATTLVAVGRTSKPADNSSGGAGDIRVEVDCGIFRFDNSGGGDAIAVTDIGATCYIVDDQTVAKTNGSNTRSAAGRIHDVDALGVWVRFL